MTKTEGKARFGLTEAQVEGMPYLQEGWVRLCVLVCVCVCFLFRVFIGVVGVYGWVGSVWLIWGVCMSYVAGRGSLLSE